MPRPIRLVLVEDSEDDAALLERALARTGWTPECLRVETEQDLRAALRSSAPDAVISDWVLPQFSGMAALGVVHSAAPDLPFVICSGKIDEEMAVSALRAGAHDFVTKGNLARLGPALERELRDAQERRQQRRTEAELAQARVQLERARRLEEAGTIAGQVAHDVGNLLGPLLLNAELIRKHVGEGHPASPLADKVIRGLRQLGELNEDLLTLGRRGQLRLAPTDLNAVVRGALSTLREPPPSLRLEVSLAPDLPPVAGASAQLSRVVANLVANARDAMRDEGRLVVRTAVGEASRGALPAGTTRCAVLEVADSGCGIPPDELERIFEPFYTTKAGTPGRGSGLGLCIVQAIVTDHRGTVDVASEPGKGATFTVRLPATAT
jgi:signal transduction histidine kinase